MKQNLIIFYFFVCVILPISYASDMCSKQVIQDHIANQTPPTSNKDWENYFKYIIKAKNASAKQDYKTSYEMLNNAACYGINEKYFEIKKETDKIKLIMEKELDVKRSIEEISKITNKPSISFPSDYDSYSSFECFNNDKTSKIKEKYDKAIILIHGYHKEKIFSSPYKTNKFYKRYWKSYIDHFSNKNDNILICTYNWNTHSGMSDKTPYENNLLKKLIMKLSDYIYYKDLTVIAHSQGGNYAKLGYIMFDKAMLGFIYTQKYINTLLKNINEFQKNGSNIKKSDLLFLKNYILYNQDKASSNYEGNIPKLITLATPHIGTSLSNLRNMGAILEMIDHTTNNPDENFLKFLNSIINIADKYDNLGIRETLPNNAFLQTTNKYYMRRPMIFQTYTVSGENDLVVNSKSSHAILIEYVKQNLFDPKVANTIKVGKRVFSLKLGHEGFIKGNSKLFRLIDDIIWQ